MNPRYRPEIDGLRALAVVPVVLFHFDVPGFSGGYVGVDVFFVISGFLITSIIMEGLRKDSFSIGQFYERRVRRIIPALAVVGLFSFLAAYLLFMPEEFEDFGRSLVSTTLFLSNVFFWSEVGYFDAPADLKPLLHTWSLAVEEQFYIIFPILVLVLSRFDPRLLKVAVAGIFVVSLLVSVITTESHPAAAFYLLGARAWELMLGAALALGLVRTPESAAAKTVLGLAGLTMILASVILYSRATPFPGYQALLPCLGAAAIILAGPGRHPAARILSIRPCVGLGLVSYSLYLWHWPVYVFASYVLMRPMSATESALAMLLSLAASWASWRWVEQPVRRSSLLSGRVPVFGAAGAAGGVLLAAGLASGLTGGLPNRLPSEVVATADPARYLHPFRHCHGVTAERLARGDLCRIGAAGAEPSFAIWGDSHADMLVPAFAAAAEAEGMAGYVFTRGGCAPLVDVSQILGRSSECEAMIAATLEFIQTRGSIDRVFLAGYWRRQDADPERKGQRPSEAEAATAESAVEEVQQTLRNGLAEVLSALPDRQVTLVADVPELSIDPPSIAARRLFMGLDADLSQFAVSRADYEDSQAPVNLAFESLLPDFAVARLEVGDVLCPTVSCDLYRDGVLLYRNKDHLSAQGAALLVDLFRTALSGKDP